jgi:uncharacterized protein (DUF2141 family)
MKKGMRLFIAGLIVLVALSLLAINTGHAQIFVCPPATPAVDLVRPPFMQDVTTLPQYVAATPIMMATPLAVQPPVQQQLIYQQHVHATPGQLVYPPAQAPAHLQDAQFITCPSPGATIVCPPIHTTPGQIVYPPVHTTPGQVVYPPVHTTPGQVVSPPTQPQLIQMTPGWTIYPPGEQLAPGQVYAPAPVDTPIIGVRQQQVLPPTPGQVVYPPAQQIVCPPGQIHCPPAQTVLPPTAPAQCVLCPTPGATVVCPPAHHVYPPAHHPLCPAPGTVLPPIQVMAPAPHYRTAVLCPPGTVGITNTGDLTIRARDFHRARGQAIVALFNARDGYPYDLTRAAAITTIPVTDARDLSVTFAGVPYGTYAVSVFHDEEMANIVRMDRYNQPLVGTGFYNWRIGLGDPGFMDSRFVVNSPSEFILVNMNYPLI